MDGRIIETVGFVTKKELLETVDYDTKSNKLILESEKPFPGYYTRHYNPYEKQPYSIFAVTKLVYNDERIIRAIQSVKEDPKFTFDAAPGSLMLSNKNFNFIRFKDLPYQDVKDVLELFNKNGIEIRKSRKVSPYETLIKVRKFFCMKEKINNVFQDLDEEHMSYIVLPRKLVWATFEKITTSIKYNIDDKNFDAAQTTVFAKEGILDLVRIYDRDSCQGKLLHIKEKYEEAILNL